jgi:U3 small nucleolar RNA-associated protein 19
VGVKFWQLVKHLVNISFIDCFNMSKRGTPSQNGAVKKQKKSALGLQKSSEEVTELCEGIIESPKNYNDLVRLLDWLDEGISRAWKDQTCSVVQNLVRVFGRLAKKGALNKEGEAHTEVSQWLQQRLIEFCDKIQLIPNNAASHTDVLAIYVSAVLKMFKVYSIKEGNGFYPKRLYKEFLRSLIVSPHHDIDVSFAELQGSLDEFDDLRYYFYVEVAAILQAEELTLKQSKRASSQLVAALLSISSFPKTNDDLKAFYLGQPDQISKASLKGASPFKISSHQVAFQKCWLQVLSLPQSPQQNKSVLAVLHQKIIPNMIKPQLLMDYLTDSYNAGGSTALLALNGLFSLIQTYNLDYPDFYTKLYALFDCSILYVRYRSRFFRLVDLFLSSSHLPAAIVASFIKRISRLALYAPPAAVVACVPFIYNQLKRHPTCMTMIHNPKGDIVTCPFDNNEPDPLKTNALQSSLWELETLQTHYHPNVASLARIMTQPFTKPQYILEDFLDHSYKALMDSEHKRKLKNVPALEFETFDHTLEIRESKGQELQGSIFLKGWCL